MLIHVHIAVGPMLLPHWGLFLPKLLRAQDGSRPISIEQKACCCCKHGHIEGNLQEYQFTFCRFSEAMLSAVYFAREMQRSYSYLRSVIVRHGQLRGLTAKLMKSLNRDYLKRKPMVFQLER